MEINPNEAEGLNAQNFEQLKGVSWEQRESANSLKQHAPRSPEFFDEIYIYIDRSISASKSKELVEESLTYVLLLLQSHFA